MRYILFLLLALSLTSSKCKKDECNYTIEIRNNSPQNIISAIPVLGFGKPIPDTNEVPKCRLSGEEIKMGEFYKYRPYHNCIENRLSDGSVEEIYIVDPNNFNNPNELYSCDSIELKNTILKHYVLSLEDLKNSNFIITYP
jgi:hypothetical protein